MWKVSLLICLLNVIYALSCNTDRNTSKFAITVVTDGTYYISVNDNIWLKSAPTFFRANGKIFSAKDGTLKLLNTTGFSGHDDLGQWQATLFNYEGGGRPFQAGIYVYRDPQQFVIFKQVYPEQVNATQAPSNDEVIAGFPGFQAVASGIQLGYMAYGGDMTGDTEKRYGLFQAGMDPVSGLNSGPITIFDLTKNGNAVVISPASKFMATNMWVQNSRNETNIYWGILGGISDITPSFETSTIVYFSDEGINKAFAGWGNTLQKQYKRDSSFTKSDFTNNYLGYWTDNGAYYYYNTEPQMNYQDTMVDVANYIKETGIPFRYVQYDSWWYYKGLDNGVKTWVGMPDVFPNGMQWLYNNNRLPVSAHNRWWSTDTTYAKQNGGDYNFIIDGKAAVPIDQSFWDDLMADAKEWGLITYEQDWLNDEFTYSNAFMYDVNLGEQWLTQMAQGAARNGITIQYCMAMSRHVMQAFGLSVVTQARASDDYHPGGGQWKIGVSSILADAIGFAPFKDNFWTTTKQPGSPYKGATEPYTELNALVATLSTGPVGPSDMIGKFNKTIIMRCVNSAGLILKPSHPAKAIDDEIRQRAFGGKFGNFGPFGEVWTTYTDLGNNGLYGIILAAELNGSYSLTPSKAGFKGFPQLVAFSARQPSVYFQWTEDKPLLLAGCSTIDFCLYYASPIISLGSHSVILLGELRKWVPVSSQRILGIDVSGVDIQIRVKGGVEEAVSMCFATDNEDAKCLSCILNESGEAVFSYSQWRCFI